MIRSVTTARFWSLFDKLPPDIQAMAERRYELFSQNPGHPSLRFKQVGPFWSVRVTDAYRALALREGQVLRWVWIGSHDDYDRMLK